MFSPSSPSLHSQMSHSTPSNEQSNPLMHFFGGSPAPASNRIVSSPPPMFPFQQPTVVKPPVQTAEEMQLKDWRRQARALIHTEAVRFPKSLLDLAVAVTEHRDESGIPEDVWDEEFGQYIKYYQPFQDRAGPRAFTQKTDSEADRKIRMEFRGALLPLGALAQQNHSKTEAFVAEADRIWHQLAGSSQSPVDESIRDEEINKALSMFKLSIMYDVGYYRMYARAIATGGPIPM